MKLLFITLSGPVAIERDSLFVKMFECLSRGFEGYIIASVMKPSFLKVKTIGRFKLITFPYRWNFIERFSFSWIKAIIEGARFWKDYRYEVIICRDPVISGISGFILKKITRAKLILDIRGNFKKAFETNKVSLSNLDIIKKKVANFLIPSLLKRADIIKLLYKDQISSYKIPNKKIICFPDFTETVSFEKQKKSDKKYILFVGGPWFLKGVDLLIKAFNKISHKFPDYRLKIYGWTWKDEKSHFENLAKENPKIEIHGPVPRSKVAELMAGCSLFVLPSRTEAMGRVLIEAMISKKPIVAANVGGIPSIVKDNFNGLLFEKENVDDLAKKMEVILKNKSLTAYLSKNGYKFAKMYLSEEVFLKNFQNMISMLYEE